MKETNKHYETPQVEVIEIESQGMLCTSAEGDGARVTGDGFQFGIGDGQW